MKRLLFFSGHRIAAWEWTRGRLDGPLWFDPDESGRDALAAWLRQAPRTPVQLLLDIVEEEFHIDRVPHVIGRDRVELHRRTAQRHFRQTEFRYIVVQGRWKPGADESGRAPPTRRDDQVLIAGLTNPDMLAGWLGVIESARVPLRGIHSLPLVGETLLSDLGAGRTPRALVVSQQIPSTLRQSYYENGRLRFSRLVPGDYTHPVGYAASVQRELGQTLHFLEAQRFRSRDEPIEIFVLAGGEHGHTVGEQLTNATAVTCHVVPLDRLAARMGVRGESPSAHADVFFARTLLRQRRPTNHYGLPRLRRHFFVQRARLALNGLAAVATAGALALAAGTFVKGRIYEDGTGEARTRTAAFERLYEKRLHHLDAFEHPAIDIKDAVDLMSALDARRVEHPGAQMAAVGAVLRGHGDIVLDRLVWRLVRADDRAEAHPGDRAAGAWSRAGAGPLDLAGGAAPLRPLIRLEGGVVGFAGEYRRAVESFEAFVSDLRAAPAFDGVDIVAAPFDLETDADVSGDSGTAAARQAAERAGFALVLQGAVSANGDDDDDGI